ncbi:Anaphase-promoting complex subunit 1 [Amphibalanus amphitrite]|uniref:Anaphase-promoting complex subunit 1 n=1 Tax=Amphibalanus amphitrite TaxID=1232801 RepID=A0A6A4WJY5_AMPAM|nr:Anaphase-promoting complex subunit 1 [Amphibalanus amphitrite]
MISVRDPKEFIPHGRGHCSRHPRDVGLPPPSSDAAVAATVTGKQQAGRWRLYLYPEDGEDAAEEELYTEDNVLICSRGQGAHRAFTLDAPVSNALRCEYTSSAAAHVLSEHPPQATDASQRIAALSCVSAAAVHSWTDDGEHFITPLPFQVRRLWAMNEGLLVERHVTEDDKLPTLFSLLHPLDDIAPLITRIGACEPSLATGSQVSVALVCRRPPLCVTYDQQTGTHTVWRVRRTEPAEWWAPDAGELTMAATPRSLSHCSVGPSPAHGSQLRSEGGTPLPRSRNNSRLNASAALHSLSAGPGPHSRSQSPSVLALSANTASYLRLHVTPSPQRPSASTTAGSVLDETILEQGEPLRPEICLQHVWRDSLATSEPARGGFLTTDLSGVSYVVLLLPSRGQARLIRLDTAADGALTVRGQGTTLQARDAVAVPSTSTMLVVDQCSSLLLYSGLFRLCKVHVPGIPPPSLSLSLTLPPSPAWVALLPAHGQWCDSQRCCGSGSIVMNGFLFGCF